MKATISWVIFVYIVIVWPNFTSRAQLSRLSHRSDSRRRKIVPAEYVDFVQPKKSLVPSEIIILPIKYKCKNPKMLAIRILATDIRQYHWEVSQNNQSIPVAGEGVIYFEVLLPALLRVGQSIVQLDAFAHQINLYAALIEPKKWEEDGISSVHLAGINGIYPLNIWGHSVSFCENEFEQYRDKTCKIESEVVTLVETPITFSGEQNGITRKYYRMTMSDLSIHFIRLDSYLDKYYDPSIRLDNIFMPPSVTVSLWVYIARRCPYNFCSIIFRQQERFLTPHLYEIKAGNLHVQVELSSGKPYAFLTGWKIPVKSWVHILLTICSNTATIYMSSDDETLVSRFDVLPGRVRYNHNERQWTLGGNQNFPSFTGYLSKVTLFRRHCIHYDLLPSDHKEPPELVKGSCPSAMWRILRKNIERYQICLAPVNEIVTPEVISAVNTTIKNNYKNGSPGLYPTDLDMSSIGDELYYQAFAIMGGQERTKKDNQRAFKILDYAGCAGSSDAYYFQGTLYTNGIGTPVDIDKGIFYILLSGDRGNQFASMALGFRQAHGIDRYPIICDIAYAYLKLAAIRTREDLEAHRFGDVDLEEIRLSISEHLEGQQGLNDGYVQFVKYQAEKGFTSAQAQMAGLLFWGNRGVKRDLRAAAKYYSMGAKNEDPDSIYNLGIVHLRGQGVPKDVPKAVTYLEKAAKMGNVNAYFALGWIAANVNDNKLAAAHYYQKAAQLNHPEAAYNLGYMYAQGQLNNGTRDEEMALKYFVKAANLGSMDGSMEVAQAFMGHNKFIKRSCPQAIGYVDGVAKKSPMLAKTLRKGLDAFLASHRRHAFLFYLMVAEAGIEFAQFNAAFICENFYNELPDCDNSVWRQYNLSAVQGHAPAKVKIADAYWYGLQGKRDSKRATQLYIEAAEKNEPQGYFNLGWLIESGQLDNDTVFTFGARNLTLTNGNLTAAAYFYERCFKSQKREAHIPCAFAYVKVMIKKQFFEHYIIFSILISIIVGAISVFGYYNACGDCFNQQDENALTTVATGH
ncbi:Protein sel-1-like protein 3 [Trichoplax sp. H2]|nr:Protein sel-1-like protein 3 [Trichoplax sp. H2]|eukprot:RDD46092.1 Protein sel-1-like protein 3 [Trichoplax sp. H2]